MNIIMGGEKEKFLEMGMSKKGDDDEYCESMDPSSFINNDHYSSPLLSFSCLSSLSSSSSSELADDASSSSSSCASSNAPSSCGPLYELSELMSQLPIKRGLSKFYHGKSQTFTSLANVASVEDLGKKECYSRRMKLSKNKYGCEGNLNRQKISPKATIAKRPVKRSLTSSCAISKHAMVNNWP